MGKFMKLQGADKLRNSLISSGFWNREVKIVKTENC